MSSDEFRCSCGGGFPGDVPDNEVCKCGTAWAKPKTTKGLRRTTPLKQGAPLKRTGGLKRTGPISRGTPDKTRKPATTARPRMTTARPPKKTRDDIPAAVRAVVLERCGGACESCGGTLEGGPVHMHHRKKRNGKNHTPDNLVALHPLCHVVAPLSVHQEPAWAEQRGLIVLAGEDSLTKPLQLRSGDLVLLDPVEPIYLPVSSLYAA